MDPVIGLLITAVVSTIVGRSGKTVFARLLNGHEIAAEANHRLPHGLGYLALASSTSTRSRSPGKPAITVKPTATTGCPFTLTRPIPFLPKHGSRRATGSGCYK